MDFNIEASTASSLLQQHRDTVARIQDAQQRDPASTDELRATLKGIDRTLDRMVQVRRVDPSETGVLEQLVEKDDVHDFGVRNIAEMREWRIGSLGSNKICVAVLNPFTENRVPQVLAAIYVYKQKTEVPVVGYDGVNGHSRAIRDYRALAGDVHAILHEGCEMSDALTRALIFYSITNIKVDGTTTPVLKGSGERLIGGLFPYVESRIAEGALPEDLVCSTLSPMRSLRGAYRETPLRLDLLDDEMLTQATIAHLLTGRDPVQRFHGGNGVLVGDVKLRANTPESNDGRGGAGVMINYVYDLDPAVRAARLQMFRARQYDALLAPHLAPLKMSMDQVLRLKMAQ